MAQNGFTRKKVESLTLGEKLKKLRGDFRMSLSDISKATKIQVKYLEYLENGQYEKLPADVYVRGFLRSYARYLNIDEQGFIKLYERERHIQENLGREQPKHSPLKDFSTASLVITPRSITMVMIVLLVGGAFLYLFQEFKSFASAPRLVILEPANSAVVQTSEVVIRGKTDKGARVSINNQSVVPTDDGDFSDKLLLQPGLNTITVRALNRFDKEKSETISLEAEYTPSTPEKGASEVPEVAPLPAPFHVDLSVRGSATILTVQADGVTIFSGKVAGGETKRIEAKETIVVTSDHGDRTFVKFNDGADEALSQKKGRTGGITFTEAGRKV